MTKYSVTLVRGKTYSVRNTKGELVLFERSVPQLNIDEELATKLKGIYDEIHDDDGDTIVKYYFDVKPMEGVGEPKIKKKRSVK